MFNAFGRMFGGGAGATPAEVAASRAAARAAAGGPSNPFDDPTLVYRDPNNEDSSSDEEDTSGPPAAPSPRRAVPPRLLGPGFPPNLPPFPGPPPPPAAAASGRAAAAVAAAAAAAAATGPPADAAPSFAGAPSTLDPTAAATAAEVAAAAAAAGIDLRPRRHRTPEERATRDHAKLLASLRSIGIPLTGRGAVEKTLKPDAVKNLPDYHGAKLLQGVRTEQDVTEWVERFISYMETQKVTAPHDICHYAFLSLRGEAHALATSLRQAGTWPTSFTGIAQVLLEHFAPPAAFEDSCRAVVDLKQGAKETSKAYILRGRRTLQQLSTLYGQVRRTRAVSVDGSSGASAAPLPELQECLFLTILEGGLLPGLRQQMRLQTHSRFNEEEMVASLQRIERTIVLRNKENSTATNGASSANLMPPQHGSPSPFNSSPSADYVDDDTSLNYGNNNQGNGNRNGSGRRPYRGNRHGDNSRPQSAPTPQGGNSALRFAPPAGATSALTPSRDRSQQRQQAPPPRPSTLNPSSGERPQDARRQLPSRGPNNSGTPGAAQQRPRPAHHGSVNLGAPAYLRATAFTDPCVIPVGMPSHWRTDDWYKMFGYDAGATLATVKVSIGSGADALDLSAAVVDTGAGNVYIRTREAESYFSLLPVADRPRVFLMPEDITHQHMPIFHAGSDASADEPGDYGGLPLPAPRLGRPSHTPANSHRPVASANMTAAGSPRYFAVPAQHGADDVDMLDFSDAPPRRSAHHAQAVQNSARGRAPRREGQAGRTPRADASRHPRRGSPPPPDYARQAYIAPAHDSPRRSSARERSRDQPVRQHNRRRSTHERSRDQRALQHDHWWHRRSPARHSPQHRSPPPQPAAQRGHRAPHPARGQVEHIGPLPSPQRNQPVAMDIAPPANGAAALNQRHGHPLDPRTDPDVRRTSAAYAAAQLAARPFHHDADAAGGPPTSDPRAHREVQRAAIAVFAARNTAVARARGLPLPPPVYSPISPVYSPLGSPVGDHVGMFLMAPGSPTTDAHANSSSSDSYETNSVTGDQLTATDAPDDDDSDTTEDVAPVMASLLSDADLPVHPLLADPLEPSRLFGPPAEPRDMTGKPPVDFASLIPTDSPFTAE
ncbi:hypothetical protein JKP88DRAFT_278231 [Tribonema minus]|uniref:Gag protein n=1 Tax=Tribonema minus TaxID=303371 RepID=A0A835YWJ7_9STRA|nr:hypothetical protein JKP88DRAFT_278231 [Tribonema minus]